MKYLILLFTLLSTTVFATEREGLKGKALAEVLKVYQDNEKLHAAFFDYKADEVEKYAKAVSSDINAVSHKEIKATLKETQKYLAAITKESEREANNVNYDKASLPLIKVIEKYDLGERYNAYSCPMVKKKWVQNSSDKLRVHNPYAPEMPHCGQRDSDY